MTINEYVKKWCDEDYDIRQEDFFVENAYYVAKREWAISGIKHGVFALFVALFTMWVHFASPESILSGFVNMGILTVCFWFYGIRNYDANCVTTGLGFYIMMAILLFITKGKVSTLTQILFAILSCAAWGYLTIFQPIQFFKIAKKMKQKMDEVEREEEEASKQGYAGWEAEYKSYRYGLPEPEVPPSDEDPMMTEARKMFEGYTENKQMLKTRYRQLAKKYHPDLGGDEKMCRCVIAVYEELNKGFVD